MRSSSSGPCPPLAPGARSGGKEPPCQCSVDAYCSTGTTCFSKQIDKPDCGLMSDTTSVVVYIDKQGGTISSSLCLLARQVLAWASSSAVTIVACYITGPWNVIADQLSCMGQVRGTKWSLSPNGSESLPIMGDTSYRHVCVSFEQKLVVYCYLPLDLMA